MSSPTNLIEFFFSRRFVFTKPQKKKILIYDSVGSEVLLKFLNKKEVEILNNRFEINFYVLFLMIFKLRFSFDIYKKIYCQLVKPKIIITFIDNKLSFYKFKKLYPFAKTIFIQNGHRDNKTTDVFYLLKKFYKNNKSLHVDHMFCFGTGIAREYKRYIKGKVTVIGSIKNNMFLYKVKKEKKIKKTVSFISQYRTNKIKKPNNLAVKSKESFLVKDFYSTERILLPILSNYCKENKYKFKVIGCSAEIEEEKLFYRSLIKNNNFQFLPKVKNDISDCYKKIYNSEILVFIDSTLGYEALSRGIKTVTFHARHPNKHVFGWPTQKKKKGPYWTNQVSLVELNRLMNFIRTVKKKNWEKTLRTTLNSSIIFNKNNEKLKRILSKIYE
jgi:surface carbohydrate biosynthesis protein